MAGRSSAHSMRDLRRQVWPAGAGGRVVAERRLAGGDRGGGRWDQVWTSSQDRRATERSEQGEACSSLNADQSPATKPSRPTGGGRP